MSNGKVHPTRISRDWLTLMVACIAARVAYQWLRPYEAITYDVRSWETVYRLLREGTNPYIATTHLNWPPLWMQVVYMLGSISEWIGVSFRSVLFTFLGIGDLFILAVLYSVRDRYKLTFAQLLIGWACNPIVLILSQQHGNFDNYIALIFLLFMLLFQRYQEAKQPSVWLTCCLLLGVGALLKTVPLIVAPLLLTHVRVRDRLTNFLGCILVLCPIILGLSIVYVLSPQDVLTKVILYRPITAFWGVSGYFHLLESPPTPVLRTAASLLVISIVGWLFLLRNQIKKLEAVRIAGLIALILLLIPVLGPGAGAQNFIWSIPLLVLLYPSLSPLQKKTYIWWYLTSSLCYSANYFLTKDYRAVYTSLPDSLFDHRLEILISTHGVVLLTTFIAIYMLAKFVLTKRTVQLEG